MASAVVAPLISAVGTVAGAVLSQPGKPPTPPAPIPPPAPPPPPADPKVVDADRAIIEEEDRKRGLKRRQGEKTKSLTSVSTPGTTVSKKLLGE